jgi:hypothetical protein
MRGTLAIPASLFSKYGQLASLPAATTWAMLLKEDEENYLLLVLYAHVIPILHVAIDEELKCGDG